MRCRKCNYLLWNIAPGRCPECGETFVPSEFCFRPGTVNFICPHCGQAYLGTDKSGLLQPRSFVCAKCDRDVSIDQMVVRPAPGLKDSATEAIVCPWLDKKRFGRWSGFWSTVKQSLIRPSEVGRAITLSGRTGSAVHFAWLCSLVGFSGIFFIYVLLGLLFIPAMGGSSGPTVTALIAGVGVLLLVLLVSAILWVIVGIGLWAVLAHGILLLSGPRESGLGTTYRALLYGQGPTVINGIPICGSYVGWIWSVVSSINILKTCQKVHGARAAIAVLAVPVIIFVLYVSIIVFATTTAASRAATTAARTVNLNSQQQVTQMLKTGKAISVAITAAADPASGEGPDHVLRLVADGKLELVDFADPFGIMSPADIRRTKMGDWTVGQLSSMTPAELNKIADSEVSDNNGSDYYIWGSCLFCYGGIDLRPESVNQHNYIIVYKHKSQAVDQAVGYSWYIFYFADGKAEFIKSDQASLYLATENNYRSKHSMPLVPLPEDIEIDSE